MKHIGTYGERRAVIRPHPMTTGWATDETCWIVEVDGERLWAESFATAWPDLDGAMRAAEARVGHALSWRKEE